MNITEIGQAIAVALGDDWSIARGESDWYVSMTRGGDGLGIWMQCRDDKRLHISPDNVKTTDENGHPWVYNYDVPNITVAASRTAASIAKDITTRLLPDAEAWHVKALAYCKQIDERAAGIKALRARLLAHPGATLSQMNSSHVYGSGWECEVHPGSTSITFRNMSDEHLFALIEAIQPKEEPMTKPSQAQPDMFPTGEDLPIFSGAPVTARARAFQPRPSQAQPGLLDLRPTFGGGEPSYTAKAQVAA